MVDRNDHWVDIGQRFGMRSGDTRIEVELFESEEYHSQDFDTKLTSLRISP